jgi:hypothetical protein
VDISQEVEVQVGHGYFIRLIQERYRPSHVGAGHLNHIVYLRFEKGSEV